MRKNLARLSGAAVCLLAGSYFALGQAAQPQKPPMTFFLSSVGLGDGADFGGLAEADAHCQDLYRNATGQRNYIWHAYLSTQERPGQPAINARDRIGSGPWYNAAGVMIAKDVADLHSSPTKITPDTALNEYGLNAIGAYSPNDPRDQSSAYMKTYPFSHRQEILTGSRPDGTAFPPGVDHTCNNYTSRAEGTSIQRARLNKGPGVEVGQIESDGVWNSYGISGGCNFESLARSHGAGQLYCFAAGPYAN